MSAVLATAVVSWLAVVGDSVVRAVEAVGPWVWRASWQGAVLAVGVAVVLKVVGRRLSPGWRFGLWGLVLVRLAVPPVVEVSWWEGEGVAAAVGDAKQGGVTFNSDRLKTIEARPSPLPSPTAERAIRLPMQSAALGEGEAVRPIGVPVAATSAAPAWDWTRIRAWAMWAWVAGVVLLAVRVIVSSVRLGRAVRRCEVVDDPRVLGVVGDCCAELGVRRAPGVRSLAAGGGPALVGWWRPVILLPPGVVEGMSAGELRLIVLHELAHVRRRDVLVNWLATAVAVVHWPNPAVWLVMSRMRFERELACDEVVLRAGRAGAGVGDPGAYARTIFRLAEALSCGGGGAGGRVAAVPVGGVGIIEGKTQLQRRLQMIARFDATTAAGRRWPVVAMGLSILVGAAALGGATRAADKPVAKPEKKTTTALPPAALPGGQGGQVSGGELPGAGGAGDPNAAAADPGLGAPPGFKDVAIADPAAAAAPAVPGLPGATPPPTAPGAGRVKSAQKTVVAKSAAEADPANAKTAEKLKKPMQVQFAGQAFSDAIDFLRDATGVDILVQWQQLEAAGMTKDQPVTIHLREPTPADAVLALMFRTLPVRLQFEVDRGVVVIGTVEDVSPATAPEVTRVYDVSDLVGRAGGADGAMPGPEGGPGGFAPPAGPYGRGGGHGGGGGGPGMAMGVGADEMGQLIQLITRTVQPESWRDAGGQSGSITSFKGKLVVKATEAAHKEVAQLLEMLREGPKKGKG
jgi:beta-lactamase regulating signal transducer with metallopeptidase domain